MLSKAISLNSIIGWVAGPVQAPYRMLLLEKLLYLWLIVSALIYLPIRDLLWGEGSLFAVSQAHQGLVANLYCLLNYSRHLDGVIFFLHLGSAVLAFLGLFRFIPKAIVYLTGYMLYYAAYMTFNGGMIVCLLFSFYLIFSSPGSKPGIRAVFTNLAFIACVTQVLLIYAEAAATKWVGIDWREGSAIYYAIHLRHYADGWVAELFGSQKFLLVIAAYLTLLYQTVFPFLIWFRKFKYPLLAAGVLFHLGIAVFLSLYDFGLALIVAYALFVDESWAKRAVMLMPDVLIPRSLRAARQ
jgi:hypothetical protein